MSVHGPTDRHQEDQAPPPIRIHPQSCVERDGWLRRSALVEGLAGREAELWFDIEPRHADLLTRRADPWLLALVFGGMETGSGLVVNGEVSHELLTNLERFQEVWRLWAPDRYRPVSLSAVHEVHSRGQSFGQGDMAVMAFSGGLNGCYTAWKHVRGMAGRQTLNLVAGLMVLGIEPSIHAGVDQDAMVDNARKLLRDLDVDLWTMRTNARAFVREWAHAYGAVLAACLHWFGGTAPVAMLAGGGTFSNLNVRCGSHCLTDPLLSSDLMRVVHDGAEGNIVDKAEVVAAWAEAIRRLRPGSGPKRTLTSLAFAAHGGQIPAPLLPSPTPEQVQSLSLESAWQTRDAGAVLRTAEARNLRQVPWYEPLCQHLAKAPGQAAGPHADRVPQPPKGAPSRKPSSRQSLSEIHVFPEPPAPVGDRFVLSARIEGLANGPKTLWFGVEPRHARYLSALADPFACALQIPAMRSGADLVVHGPVSRVLLRNLEQFQQVWQAWAPHEMTPVPMRADSEVAGATDTDGTLMIFSGGMDSSFSVYRHHRGLIGRRSRPISAALMVLGFDILLAEADEFPAAFENSRRMLESIGVDLWSMTTNFRDVVSDWNPGHGTAIAACAHCFAGHFGTTLVGATATAGFLDSPWGSHVITDRLLSSDRLRVMTDGEDAGRMDKAVLLSEWPEAMRRLRVCFLSERRDRNCGECPKCVLTALAFMASGLPLPSSLPRPSVRQIRRLPLRAAWEIRYSQKLARRARTLGFGHRRWCIALQQCAEETLRHGADPGEHRDPRWRRVLSRLGWPW